MAAIVASSYEDRGGVGREQVTALQQQCDEEAGTISRIPQPPP